MYVCIYWLHKSIYEYINRYKISNQIHYHYFDQWDAGWDPRRSFLRVAPQLACSVFQTFLVRNDLLGSKISNVPGKNACSMCFFFCFWALRICRTSINLSIHLSIIFLFFCQRTPHAWGSYLSWQAPQTSWRDVLRCLATQRRAWKKNAIRKKQGDIGCPFPIGVWKCWCHVIPIFCRDNGSEADPSVGWWIEGLKTPITTNS